MKFQLSFKRSSALLPAILLTVLTQTAAFAQGPSNGGGGFQYPNSRALLKKVSTELAQEILSMDQRAFAKMPKGFSSTEIARLIREVKYRPDLNKSRTNPDGEQEGLMFDYTEKYCEDRTANCPNPVRAIIANEPFFDTYRALPMKQLAAQKFTDAHYQLTEKDVKQRLLHEVAHLMGIGKAQNGSDDERGDEFANRVLNTSHNQVFRCDAKSWVEVPEANDHLYWASLFVHRNSGNVAVLLNPYTPTMQEFDPVTKLARPLPPPKVLTVPYPWLKQMMDLYAQQREQIFIADVRSGFQIERPWSYTMNAKGLEIVSKAMGINGTDAVSKFHLNFENGEGVYETPARYSTEKFQTLQIPVKCQALTNVIEFHDLYTRR